MSRRRRSRSCRLVTNLPSVPANGELLVSKVMAIAGVLPDFEREPIRLGQDVVRPGVGNPVGPERDLDRHARPLGVAQPLDDAPARPLAPEIPGRLIDDLHDHHFAVRAAPVRNHHVVVKVSMIGRDDSAVPRAVEAADHDPVVPFEHLDHDPRPLGGELPAPPREPDLAGDPVAVHEPLHLSCRKEHVVAPFVAGEEPVAVAMSDHAPLHHFRAAHRVPPGQVPQSRSQPDSAR